MQHCMGSPKTVQAVIVLFFIAVVTVSFFFLLRQQLAPLVDEIGGTTALRRTAASAATPTPPPPATLTAMNLVLAATIAPLATSATPTATAPILAPAATVVQIGIVNGDMVNVRSYPDLASDVVGQAQQGAQLEILATSSDGKWLQVCCPLGTRSGDRQSWIAAEFVTVQPAVTSVANAALSDPLPASAVKLVATPAPDTVAGTVNGSAVNLRSGPGTMYAVVGQAQEQSTVQLTGRDAASTWWRICCPPGAPAESWISAEFINITIPKSQALTLVPVVTTVATPTSGTGAP